MWVNLTVCAYHSVHLQEKYSLTLISGVSDPPTGGTYTSVGEVPTTVAVHIRRKDIIGHPSCIIDTSVD